MVERRSVIPAERIEAAIILVRGQKVMLDKDLASLYGVTTGTLNRAVQRNVARFPDDFMFQLTWEEATASRSQIVTLNDPPTSQAKAPVRGRNIKYRPYAFTEQGVAMLSSVLRSDRAVAVNVEIMRAFVRMRQVLASHADLARKLEWLEKKYDTQFKAVFDAIRELMTPPPAPSRGRFGFAPHRAD